MQEAEGREEKAEEGAVVPGPSFVQKWRLPLLIGGGVLLVILCLLLGILIGSSKRGGELKRAEERIAVLKKEAEAAVNEQKIAAAKVEGLTETLKQQKASGSDQAAQFAALQAKVDCFEQASALAAAREQQAAEARPASPGTKGKPRPDSAPAKNGYVRFGNEACTLVTGGGVDAWKECLKQNKTPPTAPTPAGQ